MAEGLSVLDVAPSREEIEQRVDDVARGHFRRPVLVLGIDGAYVPSPRALGGFARGELDLERVGPSGVMPGTKPRDSDFI